MNPLTTIINPLKANEILLFYITNKNQLGLEYRPFEGTPTLFVDNGTKVTGAEPAQQPGALTALIEHGSLNVYGIINATNPSDVPISRIAQLSPVYRQLSNDHNSETTSTALASAKGSSASYLYFINQTNKVNSLSRMKITPTTVESTTAFDVPLFLNDSRLIAFTDEATKDRWLVFQTTDEKRLRVVDDTGEKYFTLDPTSVARATTPLACAYTGDGDKKTMHLYFVNTKDQLMRIKRTGPTEDDYSAPALVKTKGNQPVPLVLKDSLLSAVTTNKGVNIFYMVAGGNGWSVCEDNPGGA